MNQVVCSGQKTDVGFITFAYYHERCFLFPTRFIAFQARNGGWRGVEWHSQRRIDLTLHMLPSRDLVPGVLCSACGEEFCTRESQSAMYDIIVTEGDLRAILAAIERRRSRQEKPFCLQLHIEITPDRKLIMKNTIEELRRDMIAELFEKGDLDLI